MIAEREVKELVEEVDKELGGSDIVRNLHYALIKGWHLTTFIDDSEPRRWWTIILGLQ